MMASVLYTRNIISDQAERYKSHVKISKIKNKHTLAQRFATILSISPKIASGLLISDIYYECTMNVARFT